MSRTTSFGSERRQELSTTTSVRQRSNLPRHRSTRLHQEISLPMDMNAVVWFEIYVKDMPRAKTFYEGVFGKKLEKLGDPGPGTLKIVLAKSRRWKAKRK
jgi:hypothetical protein